MDKTNFKIKIYDFLDNSFYFEYIVDSSYGELGTVSISGEDNYIAFTTNQKEEIKLLEGDIVFNSDVTAIQNSSSDENNLGIHEPSNNTEYFSNMITKYAYRILTLSSFIGVNLSGSTDNSYPNVGAALLKTFQLIEILGKFLYIPVIYKGILLDGLSGINDIGDAVTLPENVFLGKVNESASTKGKITIYSTSSYVLKTMPVITLYVIILLILNLLFTLIGKNKKYIRKIYDMIKLLEWYALETTLIDTFFFSTIGLKIGNFVESPTFWLDRITSIFIFSWATFKLFRMFFKIRDMELYNIADHLSDFEKEAITEGMHPKAYNFIPRSKHGIISVNFSLYINILFKMKIAMVAIIIVSM